MMCDIVTAFCSGAVTLYNKLHNKDFLVFGNAGSLNCKASSTAVLNSTDKVIFHCIGILGAVSKLKANHSNVPSSRKFKTDGQESLPCRESNE